MLEHVQAHAGLANGLFFSGGTANCSRCVASGSGAAGLAWERGWQGTASHLLVLHGPEGVDGVDGANDSRGHDLEPRSRPVLANATLVHANPYGARASKGAGLRLGAGTALVARDLLVTGFRGGALDAGGRAALLFAEGESRVERALLYRNGHRPLRGGIATGVDFEDRYPRLRNILWEANPDRRPEARSPALPKTLPAEGTAEGTPPGAGQYVGAFGEYENWLEEWTFFAPESDYDTLAEDDGAN
ncbi:MAG: hypothetical protein OXN97_01120 [Bryobacterales bacterium]|nr:hypothetical protein [Bryobacterales bacterium]MDE0625402.1 hypothetical protein [Bryobacterales bacterium]